MQLNPIGTDDSPVELSKEHLDAVNRRRRIIVEYDAFDPSQLIGSDLKEWLAFRFDYIDEEGSQIDSLWWDFASSDYSSTYKSEFLPLAENDGLKRWREQGIDVLEKLVEETKKRGLEAFFSHRISEVDLDSKARLEMKVKSPLKAEHPDWVIKTWWWQGMWNLASPGLREYKLLVLREIAERYDFDGIQINFARHTPCLPLSRQWENRAHVTHFIRMVRMMLLEIEKQRGKPYLLAVKVPETLEGCRIDGFDVAAWARDNLFDIFSLGSRTMDVDIEAFRKITKYKNIKLCPCFDDHHATDGYMHGPVEFLRGVYTNWWHQGADGVETFNWSTAKPEVYKRIGAPKKYISLESHQKAYHEIGSLDTLKQKDKMFVVERRGLFPWADGYFCRNDFAPLPVLLANDGRPADVKLKIFENILQQADSIKQLVLRIILYGASRGDQFEVKLNAHILDLGLSDYGWKDPQVFSPEPQRPAGTIDHIVDPEQKLLMLAYSPKPEQFSLGENRVIVSIVDRVPYLPGIDIQLEKIEVLVYYR